MPDSVVLVTGGAGFIGSHLCRRFLVDGCEVRAIDNFHSNYSRKLKEHNISKLSGGEFTFIDADICIDDLDVVTRDADHVVHLAARAGVRPSLEDPEGYARANLTGTIRVLESAIRMGVGKVTFASSSSVYGNAGNAPFNESTTEPRPISPYGWTKLAGEGLCRLYHDIHGIDITALRFFTVYGPGQRPDMAIHMFIRSALMDEPVVLYGDGSTSRDYTFIDDIINAIVSSLDLKGFDVINLGNSTPIDLKGLVALISDVTGRELQTISEPLPQGDMLRTHADTGRAVELLDYSPSTSLKDGLEREAEWIREAMDEGIL